MPTGYTADIEKGINFYEYAMGCARAFGALVQMRDEGPDAKIPDKFEPSDYHLKALLSASLELSKYMGMHPSVLATEARVLYDEEMKSKAEGIARQNNLKRKYKEMLAQAKSYVAPTPDHVEYRNFMIKQIEESMNFDCGSSYYENSQPVLKSPEEYRKFRVDSALVTIERSSKNYQKELESCASRTKWVQAMKKSLEPYRLEKVPTVKITVVEKDTSEMPETLTEALRGVQGGMEQEKIELAYTITGVKK